MRIAAVGSLAAFLLLLGAGGAYVLTDTASTQSVHLAAVCDASRDAALLAGRIVNRNQSYSSDSKIEAPKVLGYLRGGPRPAEVDLRTHMGRHLTYGEDVCRALEQEPPPTTTTTTTTTQPPTTTEPPPTTTEPPPPTGGYPNAATTGPTGTLAASTGDMVITTAGTVIANRFITGCVEIRANNVTIRNTHIRCLRNSYAIRHLNGNTGLLVEDVIAECGPDNGTCITGTSAMTIRRTEVFGAENLIWVEEDSLIEDNYLHDPEPYDPVSDPHTDGLQMPTPTRNVTIRHNTIYGSYIGGSNFGNSAITSGQSTNVLVHDNLLAGGGHTLRCPAEPGGYTWTNNRFSRIFVSTVGGFGPLEPSCAQHTHSGNVIHETGEPVG